MTLGNQAPANGEIQSVVTRNSQATLMLSAIVQKTTGQKMLDYLRPRLFDPLGIENPVWQESADGISLGASGLELKTEDIARFEQEFIDHLRRNDLVLPGIRETGLLSDDAVAELERAVAEVKQGFRGGDGKAIDAPGHDDEVGAIDEDDVNQEQIVRQKR